MRDIKELAMALFNAEEALTSLIRLVMVADTTGLLTGPSLLWCVVTV